ncbi:MAG TPA: hypothetical protein PKE12_05275 [Kiritimatiellia bacterium]|nr:hypothetical protein [Kiritimatiellia bacterium]
MPDALLRRAKIRMAERGTTFRSLVIDALEQSLDDSPARPFKLREASAGYEAGRKERVSRKAVNKAIDEGREPRRPA